MEKSPQPQSIDEALQWHAAISDSVSQHHAAVLAAFRSGSAAAASRFFGMTEDEIEEFFIAEQREVDGMCVVNIMAAAEVAIRRDYHERVRRNRGDHLSAAYAVFQKRLGGQKSWRPDFDRGGILDVMRNSNTIAIHLITDFRHALKIRHWFAHGRHHLLRTTAEIDAEAVHASCRELLDALPS